MWEAKWQRWNHKGLVNVNVWMLKCWSKCISLRNEGKCKCTLWGTWDGVSKTSPPSPPHHLLCRWKQIWLTIGFKFFGLLKLQGFCLETLKMFFVIPVRANKKLRDNFEEIIEGMYENMEDGMILTVSFIILKIKYKVWNCRDDRCSF